MLDMRFIEQEGQYLEYAWEVYSDYFSSRGNFVSGYEGVPNEQRKNLFLMIVAGYKQLVRDGEYHLVGAQSYLYIGHLDQTYKFISIMSLIEAMFADEPHIDFYEWLTMRKRRQQVFPIESAEALRALYCEYKAKFGAKRAVRFFSELDDGAQQYLASRVTIDNDHKPAEVIARKLYLIRSEFVHQ